MQLLRKLAGQYRFVVRACFACLAQHMRAVVANDHFQCSPSPVSTLSSPLDVTEFVGSHDGADRWKRDWRGICIGKSNRVRLAQVPAEVVPVQQVGSDTACGE